MQLCVFHRVNAGPSGERILSNILYNLDHLHMWCCVGVKSVVVFVCCCNVTVVRVFLGNICYRELFKSDRVPNANLIESNVYEI